jgi:hypothetical protein
MYIFVWVKTHGGIPHRGFLQTSIDQSEHSLVYCSDPSNLVV